MLQFRKFTQLLFIVLLAACTQIKDKVTDEMKQHFVDSFNNSASAITVTNQIDKAIAMIDSSSNEVLVKFYLGAIDDNIESKYVEEFLSKVIINFVDETMVGKTLINDGHYFITKVYDNTGKLLVTEKINKKKFDKWQQLLADEQSKYVKCEVPEMLGKLFVTMNSGLPQVDTTTNLSFNSIVLAEDRVLEYEMIMLEGAVLIARGDDLKSILILNLQANQNFNRMSSVFTKHDIHKLRYNYRTETGEEVETIEIDFTEISDGLDVE